MLRKRIPFGREFFNVPIGLVRTPDNCVRGVITNLAPLEDVRNWPGWWAAIWAQPRWLSISMTGTHKTFPRWCRGWSRPKPPYFRLGETYPDESTYLMRLDSHFTRSSRL